jgi:DNA repair exonuclease SbcCD ATPase subunit
MSIKDIIAKVRTKVDPENLEKIDSLLSDVIRAESELIADRSSANEESRTRKEKIRELETTIETMKTETEAIRKEAADKDTKITDLEKVKTAWESAKTERETAAKTEWDGIKKRFDVKETDKGFDQINKIKKYYTFADNLTPEQISRNLEIAKQHEELGLFSVDPTATPPANTPKGSEPAAGLTEIKPW